MTTVAIVYHSAYGHTKKMAEAVAKGAADGGAKTVLVPVEDADAQWGTLAAADAIVFGSPTYMGGVSAQFKTFMDASSKVWMERGWQNKIAAGFTTSGSQSGDKLNTLVQLAVYAAQHGMIWAGLNLMPGNNSSKGTVADLNRLGSFLGAMAQSNVDEGPEVAPPQSDLATAGILGQRVAEIAKRFAG